VVTSAEGTFTTEWTVPETFEAGAHVISATVAAEEVASVAFRVVSGSGGGPGGGSDDGSGAGDANGDGDLAVTGGDIAGMIVALVLALGLATAGTTMVIRRRRGAVAGD